MADLRAARRARPDTARSWVRLRLVACGSSIAVLALLTVPPAGATRRAGPGPEEFGALAVKSTSVLVDLGVDARAPEGVVPVEQVDLYAPTAAKHWPVVEISHGLCNTKAEYVGLGTRLASRGFVVAVATRRGAVEAAVLSEAGIPHPPEAIPVQGTASGTCADTDEGLGAEDLLRVLRWTIAHGQRRHDFLSGEVDGRRLGMVGHSLGGLWAAEATALSQVEGPRLSASVLLDNADPGVLLPLAGPGAETSRQAAARFSVPTEVIASQDAESPIKCEIQTGPQCGLSPTATFAALPPQTPRLGLRIVGSLHGEAEDPDNDDGAAARVTVQRVWQRYTMAWLECFLRGDRAAAGYLNGPRSEQDVQATRITMFPQVPRLAGGSAC